MRTLIFLLLASASSITSAQDWALINPAYRYNYSNDGTDTISNQIRVMQVDTLGPDSFRYELNRIGLPCDTCTEALGGFCDGCYVWIDQPQFLQRSLLRIGPNWQFMDPDTFLIRSTPSVGSTWNFTPDGSVTASVISVSEMSVFDSLDSVAVIATSNMDTIVISRSYGILRSALSQEHELLGIHGPDLGRLLPTPMSYFDYYPGDALQYSASGSWYAGSGMFPWVYYSGVQKMEVVSREELQNGYAVQFVAGYRYLSGPPPYYGFWLGGSFTFTDSILTARFHPVTTYPNEITSGGCGYFPDPEGMEGGGRALALHTMDPDGKHVISTFSRLDAGQVEHGMLAEWSVPGHPRLFPLEYSTVFGSFKEGVGMIRGVDDSYFEPWCNLVLQGAVLQGDTTGGLTDDSYFFGPLSLRESIPEYTTSIFPNPASDSFVLMGALGGEALTIHDMEGRFVWAMRISAANETIDVQDLKVGMYILRLEGMRPQRLLIAR
ncbi:MAG: T9SS type A sorting domain-containing protein [Flavobacteriales bacterium]|nr:T9SS type A sorting domain-containing protein [Flavobacteriales bacterium]